MTRDQMIGWAILCVLIFIGFSGGYMAGRFAAMPEAIPEPVVVEEVGEPVVFNVDGVSCYFDTRPSLTYRPNDQTVSVGITCGVELLDAYLPAIERTQ